MGNSKSKPYSLKASYEFNSSKTFYESTSSKLDIKFNSLPTNLPNKHHYIHQSVWNSFVKEINDKDLNNDEMINNWYIIEE